MPSLIVIAINFCQY